MSDLMLPLRTLAEMAAPMLDDRHIGTSAHRHIGTSGRQARPARRHIAAGCKLLELAEVTHERPPWRIGSVLVDGEAVPVSEEAVLTTPFATLLRFRKIYPIVRNVIHVSQ